MKTEKTAPKSRLGLTAARTLSLQLIGRIIQTVRDGQREYHRAHDDTTHARCSGEIERRSRWWCLGIGRSRKNPHDRRAGIRILRQVLVSRR